jgi:hypothetical protein
MCAGSLTAGTSSNSQSPRDDEFETHTVRAPVTRTFVGGNRPAGCEGRASSGSGDRAPRKGKKRATCAEARSAVGESRRISEGNWLAALDDFRNYLIWEAA